MSDNNVTVRIDSRVAYGLIAVLAVVAAIGLGWFVGNNLGGADTATTTSPEVAQAPSNTDPIGALEVGGDTGAGAGDTVVQPAAPPAGGAGTTSAPPVHTDDVPVGEAEPRLWVEEAAKENWTVNFGTIPADAKHEMDFTLTNIGTAELVIEDTSASCGCTAATVGDTNLAPGESTMLRVGYDPRVNQEAGRFVSKQVRIKSNDPLVPLAEFTVTADVAAE